MHQLILRAALLLFLFSCNNDPQRKPVRTAAPPGIFAYYQVSAGEGDSVATCLLQYFADDAKSQTLLLQPPSGVQVDGQPLAADSSGMAGIFYEYQAPVARFSGLHVIRFTDSEKQVFADSFFFRPFGLAAEPPAVLPVKDLKLPVKGLPGGSAVRVVLTDTSSEGIGVNERVQVKEGSLLLPAAFWQNLRSGPIVLHLTFEEERPLRSGLPGGIMVTYSLSRVVELRER